jgi:hypothetical protein
MTKIIISIGLLKIAVISLMTLTFSMLFINIINHQNMTKSKHQTIEKNLHIEYQASQSEDFDDRTNQFVIFKINNIHNVRA